MSIFKTKLLLSFFIGLTSTLIFSQKLEQNPTLIKGQLDNGLTYYIYPNLNPKGEAIYRLFIKSGSIFENDNQKGLAHFLEHMAFNGTKHFPGNGIVRFLESKGAKFGKDLNAHTSYNETVYKLQLPSSDPLMVDSTMTILADWAGGLSLDSLEIESERGVIMSEWLSKTGPKYDAQNVLLKELLNESRYADRIVIGDTAVIKNFAHKEIRDYYKKWYDPSLMAVAVTGDIDPKEIEKMIYEKFGSLNSQLKGTSVPSYTIDPYSDMEAKRMIHESLDKVELVALQLLPKLKGVSTEEDYLPYLERTILNRLLNARISDLSFNDPPYSKTSVGISSFLNTTSCLLASVELTPTKIREGIDTFAINVEQIYRHGFLPLEIAKVKKSYLAALKRKAETETPALSTNLMAEIYSDFYAGNMIITPQREYELAEKYISLIDSTSLVEYLHKTVDWNKTHFIVSSFEKIKDELPSDDEVLVLFKSLKNKEIQPYSKNIEIPENLLNKIPKAGKIVGEKYIKEIDAYDLKLSNGARVIFKPSDIDKEKIYITSFRKGGLYALDSTEYVNGTFARSIVSLSGAGDFSRDALSYYLTGNTASVTLLSDKTRVGAYGSANKDDLETLFQLYYLKMTQPKIDSQIYDQVRKKAIESYQTANTTQSDIFYEDLSYLIQGKNYTNRKLTDTIIENELKQDQLIGTFNKLYEGAKDFMFVIIGNCSKADIEPYITQYLAALPKGNPKTKYKFKREGVKIENTLFERHTGETPKALVNLVFQQQNEVDGLLKENLLNDIMKSVIRTKLLKSLREEMGMVYSVSVSASSTLFPSELSRQTISFSTAPENVDQLVDRTLVELRKMVENPTSFESELNDVKTNLIKNRNVEVQSNTFWSSYIRNVVFNNEKDWTFYTNYDSIVERITTNEIANIINKRLLDDQSMIRAVLYPMKSEQ